MEAATIVRGIYEAFACGNVPAVLETLSADVEWVTPPTLPWSEGRYRGREGVAQYFGHFGAALDEPRIEVQELVAAGDRVIALGFEHARFRTTGQQFSARFAHVWTLRDGQVQRMEGIIDTATIRGALSAA